MAVEDIINNGFNKSDDPLTNYGEMELIEEKMDEIKDDPVRWLDDYGMEYQQFVDVRGLKDQLVSESDYGTLASYDGTYDEIRVDNTNYVVFRID